MMQITEDTPPDMLAGAMDLTVHLPNGRSTKMSIERSTPMMDLLVQITVANHLQLSNHTLQALGMAPSLEHSDIVLPFKPNTPIGALDTQHVRVLPKEKTLPAPKYIAPGHQPFESTFRLKVHLPRNQLYVTRVSRNVLLEDIMKKVCEEKNLDPVKYEFKHPGNLDTVLNPKLTLSDYQITEIYVVAKGTANLNQAFSTADIMSLRKEEERKQMHNKTGGGVFNLIFKRGKSSMGSGSVSSDNRSISPTHSDDSRSVTPPAVQAPPIVALPKKDPPPERPKPPQRKRRPAPKPPQIQISDTRSEDSGDKNEAVAGRAELPQEPPPKKASDNGLTICHSRNSSDSSGYHEASILSDHCANTSLPRSRPKSAYVGGSELPAQSTSNLGRMAVHSRSTTSLVTGRRKKAAPPPPPLAISPASSVITQSEKPSPLVASQSDITVTAELSEVLETSLTPTTNPTPKPKPRHKGPPVPIRQRPKSQQIRSTDYTHFEKLEDHNQVLAKVKQSEEVHTQDYQENLNVYLKSNKTDIEKPKRKINSTLDESMRERRPIPLDFKLGKQPIRISSNAEVASTDYSIEEMLPSLEVVNPFNADKENFQSPVFQPHLNSDSLNVSISSLQQSFVSDIFSSQEFLNESKPSIVAVIPKTPKSEHKYNSNKDSFGKKRCFQIGSSILEKNFDAESSSISSKRSYDSKSSRNSVVNVSDDEIGDIDEEMFSGSLSRASRKKRPEVFNQLFGMHSFEEDVQTPSFQRNTSLGSFSSMSSVPGLNGAKMRKWNNSETLDSTSLKSVGVTNKWVVAEATNTESITSTNYTPGQTPFDSLPLESSTPVKNQPEDKSLESTDSGIAQDAQSEKEKESDEDLRLGTPPPPPILDDIPNEINYSNQPQKLPEISAEVNFSSKGDTQPKSESELPDSFTKQQVPVSEPPPLVIQEAEVADVDWQYQLPSPPKAFRDSSPPTFLQNETNTVSDFKDSVVTSPELFEKLKILEDNQSENGTLTSDITSIASDDPLNSLSLEHLEKRKSLVYNRELSTSLKMTDSLESKSRNMDNFTSMTGNFQPKYESRRASTDSQKQPVKPTRTTVGQSQNHHTLPNFKISTYDVPKQNITVFEDDTIRSNTHSSTTTSRTHTGKAVENIPIFNKKQTSVSEEKEYKFYKPTPTNFGSFSSVARSGSFSIDSRFAGKPVSRSKSSLTLNKYQADNKGQESISRSNSLFDVSGLQSLEVMKLIQNKLSTPTGSMENISYKEKITVPQKQVANVEVTPKEPTKIPDFEILKEKTPHSPEPVKKYYYRGPPAVNMTTWSERPKVPVAVKEDEDYKLGNMNVSSKLIVKTTNNDMASNNTVEVKSNGLERNVNVHINGKLTTNSRNHNAIGSGSEQITQKSGNVIIKIGSANDSNNYIRKLDNKHFVDPPVYRKAFTNINRNDGFLHSNQRPHSIAFDSEFDPSRVPVVRSVELKKQYKNMHNTNTSVTHISGNDIVNHEYQNNKYTDTFVEKFRSTENLRHSEKQESEPNRKVFRVNSIKPGEHQPSTPTVRGFRNPSTNTNTNNRFSWHVSTNYGTLPHKPILEKEYNTNQNVPFSQSNLRRTESSKLIKTDANSNDIESSGRLPKPTMENVSTRNKLIVTQGPPPPPPPQIPKVALKKPTPVESKINSQPTDARDMLLESIRNFGGKKGLKTVKA